MTRRDWLAPILITAIVITTLVAQIPVDAPAFASRYNFFHLLAR
jgi:hypothetical protein